MKHSERNYSFLIPNHAKVIISIIYTLLFLVYPYVHVHAHSQSDWHLCHHSGEHDHVDQECHEHNEHDDRPIRGDWQHLSVNIKPVKVSLELFVSSFIQLDLGVEFILHGFIPDAPELTDQICFSLLTNKSPPLA